MYSPEFLLGKILRETGWKISVAESCTGGLVANKITDVPGSSEYFLGGVVAYSNDAKIKILGVKERTIRNWGAVSKQCAVEMAIGAAKLFSADIAIATTGIAGPGGGTKDKPVGTVYIAYKVRGRIFTDKKRFTGDRWKIKNRIAEYSLEKLVSILQKSVYH